MTGSICNVKASNSKARKLTDLLPQTLAKQREGSVSSKVLERDMEDQDRGLVAWHKEDESW